VIHQRLVSSANQRDRTLRPLLGADAPIEKLRKMLIEREDAYSTASVIVDTDAKSNDEVVEAIAEAWRNSGMEDSND
jgi:shikimate kinase